MTGVLGNGPRSIYYIIKYNLVLIVVKPVKNVDKSECTENGEQRRPWFVDKPWMDSG